MPRSGATVTMTTGMSRRSASALSALSTSQPSGLGIMTSSVIASGRIVRARLRASSPLAAWIRRYPAPFKLAVSSSRIEASASHADDMLRRGIDIRYVVTSLQGSDAEHIYETIYCARGQAENLIKQHKAQLSSDRTSCRSPLANQMRLILHTGAYWLLLDLRAAIPSWNPLRHTEFATIRLRLLKIASRIIEHASRIRIALASCCPEAETFSLVALKLQPAGP
jgi:Transposase DDE domain group 1